MGQFCNQWMIHLQIILVWTLCCVRMTQHGGKWLVRCSRPTEEPLLRKRHVINSFWHIISDISDAIYSLPHSVSADWHVGFQYHHTRAFFGSVFSHYWSTCTCATQLTLLLLTMVTLCPRSSPVPPSPLGSVSVPLNHRSNKSSVTDWGGREHTVIRYVHCHTVNKDTLIQTFII